MPVYGRARQSEQTKRRSVSGVTTEKTGYQELLARGALKAPPSLPGLTRQSILWQIFSSRLMDVPIKSGHDVFYAAADEPLDADAPVSLYANRIRSSQCKCVLLHQL